MSETYQIWENRYKNNGNSGAGSYDELYEFKRDIINEFINENNISSIIEFGCGDGNQIKELNIKKYIGLDISPYIVNICRNLYINDQSKHFYNNSEYIHKNNSDLTLSLDVIYHILEDDLYKQYMTQLFNFSNKYVIIYSSNYNTHKVEHMYNKKFTDYIEQNLTDWKLIQFIPQKYPKKSSADFYVYQKIL